MIHFAHITQAFSPYSMLQHVGRVAKPRLVPKNSLKYWKTTLLREVLSKKQMKIKRDFAKTWHFLA